jgi:hypothetical protein
LPAEALAKAGPRFAGSLRSARPFLAPGAGARSPEPRAPSP